MRFSGSK